MEYKTDDPTYCIADDFRFWPLINKKTFRRMYRQEFHSAIKRIHREKLMNYETNEEDLLEWIAQNISYLPMFEDSAVKGVRTLIMSYIRALWKKMNKQQIQKVRQQKWIDTEKWFTSWQKEYRNKFLNDIEQRLNRSVRYSAQDLEIQHHSVREEDEEKQIILSSMTIEKPSRKEKCKPSDKEEMDLTEDEEEKEIVIQSVRRPPRRKRSDKEEMDYTEDEEEEIVNVPREPVVARPKSKKSKPKKGKAKCRINPETGKPILIGGATDKKLRAKGK